MSALSRAYLEDLKQLLAAATPGPWTAFLEGRNHDSGSSFIRTPGEDIELTGATSADLELIARARQDLPLLIAELERLDALQAGARSAAE
jgi:hypothetical protein